MCRRLILQHGLDAHGEGGGGAAGDGKAGTDGQIQQHRKKQAVAPADLTGQIRQTFAAGDAHGGHTQQRKTHAGDDEAYSGHYTGRTGGLSHVYGENQIAGSEE